MAQKTGHHTFFFKLINVFKFCNDEIIGRLKSVRVIVVQLSFKVRSTDKSLIYLADESARAHDLSLTPKQYHDVYELMVKCEAV